MKKLMLVAALTVGAMQMGIMTASADWAIAIGQKKSGSGYAYGTAWNYTDADEARKAALSNCRSRGPNCKIVAESAGSCVGLAFGISDNAYGWAKGDTKRAAARSALDQCNKYSNGECEVKDTFCDE